jgi:hypothetical protein
MARPQYDPQTSCSDGVGPQLRKPLAVGFFWFDKDASMTALQVVGRVLSRELRHVHGRKVPAAMQRYEAAKRSEVVESSWLKVHARASMKGGPHAKR